MPVPKKRTRSKYVGKHWKNKPAVIVAKDGSGREKCNPYTEGGKQEYWLRKVAMHVRQHCLCCICRKYLRITELTFEHENGRHASRIDERIWLPDGRPLNGVSHLICNSKRGSMRTPIWHGLMDGEA